MAAGQLGGPTNPTAHAPQPARAPSLLPQDAATGQEKAGNKGVSLSQGQWGALCAVLPQLGLALRSGDTGCALPLGALRRAYVSKFGWVGAGGVSPRSPPATPPFKTCGPSPLLHPPGWRADHSERTSAE